MTAQAGLAFRETRDNPELWGRLVESAVGAHLANAAAASLCEVHYWREHNREVDFVASFGRTLTAIEVKGGRAPGSLPGIAAFAQAFQPRRTLLVGAGGVLPRSSYGNRSVIG